LLDIRNIILEAYLFNGIFSPDCMLLNLAHAFLIDTVFLKVNLSLTRRTRTQGAKPVGLRLALILCKKEDVELFPDG